MKKIITFSIVLVCLIWVNGLKAQQPEKSAETIKKEQIAALEDLISRCTDAKEKSKAQTMLAELKGNKPLSPAEEQQKMSETLSPAEYDAWKASKHTKPLTPITKPEDDK